MASGCCLGKLMKSCLPTGTMVVQVAATDADDPTYGNSARVVYSIIHGQPYFSVEPKTGWYRIRLNYRLMSLKASYQKKIFDSCLSINAIDLQKTSYLSLCFQPTAKTLGFRVHSHHTLGDSHVNNITEPAV